jgi:hypothetical protein
MSIQTQIDDIFNGQAFKRPLFYSYSGGLRFEMSEGGHYLNQFITAHRKGSEVCAYVFSGATHITVCVKIYGRKSLLSCYAALKSLRDSGLYPSSEKEHWTSSDEEWLGDEDYTDSLWHYIAFHLPPEYLVNALWCAFASDFGVINPNPRAMIYLFNLDNRIMVWPYDDRGMDMVGPNKELLKELYVQFNDYLLDYDRDAMDAVFATEP